MGMSSETHWLNGFDVSIDLFINQFAGRYPWFDSLVRHLAANTLLSGGIIVMLVWALLFDRKRPGQLREGFELLLGSVFMSLVATLIARCLAIGLPFRARPVATPELHFRVPADTQLVVFNWSAFPSDHTVMFIALACGIFFVSRKLGLFAFVWVSLIICFPLMYAGAHWPTDILAGVAIGLTFAQLARVPAVRQFMKQFLLKWYRNHPEIFFPALFLWSYETVVLFDDVRHLLRLVAHTL
jgi:undecaprenyl-diphosphatase